MQHNTAQNIPLLQQRQYSRAGMHAGIVHIGVGAFHRAHQAVFIDELLEKTATKDWGIIGINMRPESQDVAAKINAHGGGYVVKSISTNGDMRYQQVGSIIKVLDWATDQQAALEQMSASETQLITITVTESGYYIDSEGGLDASHEQVAGDWERPVPQTIYGCLYRGLRQRMLSSDLAITVQSCDNIRKNGDVLRRNFLHFIALTEDEALRAWVAQKVTFPNSMVDRITPRSGVELSDEIAANFGIEDDATVLCEDFTQWVVERKFSGNYPDLGAVGVEIVDNVHPYEEAKIRILNGGHTALTYLGVLKGLHTYDEVLADSELAAFFDAFQQQEVLPSLPTPSPVDHQAYLAITRSRLCNRFISDALARICMDGASKFPLFVMPTVQAVLVQGRVPIYSIRAIASWYLFMQRVQAGRIGFAYVEPKWDEMVVIMNAGAESFARSEQLWGDVPQQWPIFAETLCQEIQQYQQQYAEI